MPLHALEPMEGTGSADSVTLEIHSAIDEAAELVWVSAEGVNEKKYGVILPRTTVKQETFAGHCWLVRGKRSQTVLLRITASEARVQKFDIDVDAPDEGEDGTDAAAAADGEVDGKAHCQFGQSHEGGRECNLHYLAWHCRAPSCQSHQGCGHFL